MNVLYIHLKPLWASSWAHPTSAQKQGDHYKPNRYPRENCIISSNTDYQKSHAEDQQISRNSAFIEVHITSHIYGIGTTSENGLALLKSSEGLFFKVISKKSIRYALTISVTRLPFSGPFSPSCGAIGENNGRSLKS